MTIAETREPVTDQEVRPLSSAEEWRRSWPVTLAASTGMFAAVVYTYPLGVFMPAIQQETGWTRAQISSGLPIFSVIAIVFAPAVGYMVDRVGSRLVALVGLTAYCAFVGGLSLAGHSIWTWWLLWLGVAFSALLIKPTVWTKAVAGHFTSARGMALGVALCGAGLGAAVVPMLSNLLMVQYSWRVGYVILGLGTALVALPLTFLFFRDPKTQKNDPSALAAVGLTGKEGLTSRAFYLLAATAYLSTAAAASISLNFVPIMASFHLSTTDAAGIASLIGISSIFGRLVCGWLLDKFNARMVTACFFAMPLLAGAIILALPINIGAAAVIAMAIGLAVGSEIDCIAYLTSRYVGLKNYGLIFGTIAGCISLGAATGPFFSSWVYDATGGYKAVVLAIVPAVIGALVLLAGLGRYPDLSAGKLRADPEP